MDEQQQLALAKLNLETGQVSWAELERHFARGAVLLVAGALDLVDVARAFSTDDKPAVKLWMADDIVRQPQLAEVKIWHAEGAEFWAIVVAPFVLIQAIAPG